MIVFCDLLDLLKRNGWTLYRIRREKLFGGSVLDHIRYNKPITTKTVDTICRLCHVQPGDIMTYVEDPDDQKSE